MAGVTKETTPTAPPQAAWPGPPLRRLARTRLVPRSLFARSLVILVTPVVLLQLIAGTVFFDHHLRKVAKRMSRAVAGEIAFLRRAYEEIDDEVVLGQVVAMANRHMRVAIRHDPDGTLPSGPHDFGGTPLQAALLISLERFLEAPFAVDFNRENRTYIITVAMKQGVLEAVVPRHRFTSSSAHILLWWVAGSTVLLLAIAILFLRRQIRPIQQLAEAAERIGRGRPTGGFEPAGALEVRQAGTAFVEMSGRIARQMRERTELLAGVSHDLRTPLTRMRLALAMLPDDPDIQGMKSDVEQMSRMIEGYLAFARGDGGESPSPIDLADLLAEVVEAARRQGAEIALHAEGDLSGEFRPHALSRCLANLVENARRYAGRAELRAWREARTIHLTIDDDGPGIPAAERQAVFRPFHRLESSRNPDTGGTGLGLTIARDAVRAHGGELALETSPLGGLRVHLRLPV